MSKRPNGTGYVYKRGNTWTARVVDHYKPADNKTGHTPVYKTKGGFVKKKDALNYVAELYKTKLRTHPPKDFIADYTAWKEAYKSRIGRSTMAGYASAFKHFADLHYVRIDRISTTDLQDCIDKCSCGKRTKQLMRVIAGLVFKYAVADDQIDKNVAQNLYVGDDETTHYEPLTDEELDLIRKSGQQPYADYIVALCYLGHRPTEFFSFTKTDYVREEDGTCYISGGIKTEAGKHRIVTVPPSIVPILEARLMVEGTDLLFPRYDYNRKGQFTGYSQMPTDYFNTFIFKPLTEKLGIIGKVTYSTRHTYANKVKKVLGADKDKASLMGHADYETTKRHYQSTNLADLKEITDQIG
jgi:integrase